MDLLNTQVSHFVITDLTVWVKAMHTIFFVHGSSLEECHRCVMIRCHMLEQ